MRAAAAHWILLFALRLIGRRNASQMAPFDLVVLFLFAGLTITAVLADDHNIVGACSGICTIGLMHILASWLKTRSDRFGRIIDGTLVVGFEHGEFNRRRMSRLRLTLQDVMAAARQRGLMRLDQIRFAVAERDGKIDRTGPGMTGGEITTDIPARLDRLPWSKFHLLVVVALGVTWILDGLQVTIFGSIGPILKDRHTLGLTDQEIGDIASSYVGGAVSGALLFGWLTDRFGRRLIFNLTLAIYAAGVLLTAFSWNFRSFAAFNAITGLGIGGEYAAINSAIDELIPARLRGRIDLIVNGSYWAGAAVGAGASLMLLSGKFVAINIGWRLAFGIGALLSGFILFLRRYVPESPRWQITHGRQQEAKQTTSDIERKVGGNLPPPGKTLKSTPARSSASLLAE